MNEEQDYIRELVKWIGQAEQDAARGDWNAALQNLLDTQRNIGQAIAAVARQLGRMDEH